MNNNSQTELSIERKNLEKYGSEEAGRSNGALENYKATLEKIYTGNIVAKTNKTIIQTQQTVDKIHAQIQSIEEKNIDLLSKINNLEDSKIPDKGKIFDLKKKIENIKNEIEDIYENGGNNKYKVFKWSNFSTYLFFFLPLSIYLLLFYTSISHSAFYGIDPTSLIQGKTVSVGILPNFADLMRAITTNYMLIFTPFVFFTFGVVIHIFLENEKNIKYLWLMLVVLVTLVLDSFIAFKIHEEVIKSIKMILDDDEAKQFISKWYEDVNFYIVLFMGFVVFIMWSIIFHTLRVEWAKRDVISTRKFKINRLDKDIDVFKSELNLFNTEKSKNNSRIELLKKQIGKDKISPDETLSNISNFCKGWCDWLAFNGKYTTDKNQNQIKQINETTDIFKRNITTFKDEI